MVVITTGTKRIATSFLLTLITSLSIILLISSIAPIISSSAVVVVVAAAANTAATTPIPSPPSLNQTTSLPSNSNQFPNISLQNQSSPSSPPSSSITTPTNTTTDTTPPDTAITSAVDGSNGANIENGGTISSSPSSSISFTFTGTDDVASVVAGYQCSIDGLPAALCKSPVSVFNNNQAPGSHTFDVRAIDTSGNVDPSPAIFTWIIANISGSSDGNSDQQQNNEPLYNIQPIIFSKY
jgi:hypothetical protein